jgi:hypothetical protein
MTVVGILVVAALALGAAPAQGQSPLEGIAGLTVDGELIESTLRLLQRTAGVSLVYSPDLLPEDRRVSCACADVTVRQALDSILKGTRLTYTSSRTQIRIVPDRAPPRPVRPGAILGRVVDSRGGAPVVNAMVRLETGQGSLSDASGEFMIVNVPPGIYRIEVTSIGWEPGAVDRVEVLESDTVTVTIRLEQGVVSLPEVLVSPGTFGVLEEVSPDVTRTLTRDEIQTLPQFGEDVFRALKRLPGVASDDISTKLNIRGGTDREVLVRLDGLELYEPYHMKDWDGALGIVDLNALGGVELTAGGFGAEFGDKLTGVFDMTSRTTVEDARTTLGLSISNLTAMSRGGFAGEKGAWLFSARRGFMDLVMKLMGEDDRLSPEYYDLFGKVSYQASSRHILSANVLHAGDDFSLSVTEWDGTQPVDGIEEGDLSTGWDSSYGWVTWKATPGRGVSATTMAWAGRVTRHRKGYILDAGSIDTPERITVRDDREFTFAGLREDLSLELSDRAMIKLGAEVKRVRSDYYYANETLTPFATAEGARTMRVDSVLVQLDPDGHEISGYVAARARPIDPLTAEVGVRYDRVSHTDDEDLAPRILVALDLTPRTRVRASWGRYYQSHGVHELDVGDGETDFFPSERADQIALGLEHRFPQDVSLRVELYRRNVTDQRPRFLNLEQELVIFPEATGDRIRIDPGKGRAKGLELMLERRSGHRWAWSASYVLAVAEDEVDGSWVPRRFDQRHTIGLHAAYRPNRAWNLSGGWRYHTGWPATEWTYDATQLEDGSFFWSRSFGPVRGTRLPAYHRLDLRVTREFQVRGNVLHAFVDLFNVYNRTNLASYDYGASYQDGRVNTVRGTGQELLPILPTFGLRYEF